MNNDLLKLLITSLLTAMGILIPIIIVFFRQQAKYEENIKHSNEYLKKLENAVSVVNTGIQLLRQELIEKVAGNKLDTEKLNTEVEKLKTRVDNIEKIIERKTT